MSRKDMLGPLQRAVNEVPLRHQGLVLDLCRKLGGEDGDERADIVRKAVMVGLKDAPPLDTVIQVNRSAKLTYPRWVKELSRPDLEMSGPDKYNLANLFPFLHPGQGEGRKVPGYRIYEYLNIPERLEECLSIQDGLAIKAKGIRVFRQFFKGKRIYLWRSVARNDNGDLFVPYLLERGDQVLPGWRRLDEEWDDNDLTPRFHFSKLL